MKTALSLYLPHWPTDRVRRRLHLDPRKAVLLTRVDHQKEIIAACCEVALAHGITVGMTLAHARSLLPADGVHVDAWDEAREAAHLKRFAMWCVRFTPVVMVDPPDGILLDATGCECLYGGLRNLVVRLVNSVRRQGFAAQLGIAPTWAAAKAAARFGPRDVTLLKRETLRKSLEAFPVHSLNLSADVLEAMHAVGLQTIGQLLVLPRSAVAARYGPEVLLRLDQAFGQAMEIITPLRPKQPVIAERLLDGPTDRLDSIEAVVQQLLTDVVNQLASRESGVRWLVLTLDRSDLDPLIIPLRLSSPSRDFAHLWALLRHRLESAHLGFGVEGLKLEALSIARLRHRQHLRWAEGESNRESLSRFVDLVRSRGLAVLRPAPAASYWPERVDQWEELDGRLRPACTLTFADRPTHLLGSPRSLKVTLLLPDGPLVGVQLEKSLQRVVSCIGPERVEAEWWQACASARDYFKVQTEDGRWLWILRHVNDGSWFLHGMWS